MVQEVETNRLIHLYTPLFFGWTISLRRKYFSGRFLFVTLKYCSISDKAEAFFGSLGGGGGGEEEVAIRGFLK
jgi:hypothetical protein